MNKERRYKKLLRYSADPKLSTFEAIEDINENMESILPLLERLDVDNLTTLKGEKGDQGERGEQGPMGPQGKPGRDGKQGRDGQDGQHGQDGLDGRDGIDGKNGKDGSPDTAKQIAEKLNTLLAEIDFKVLKNVPDLTPRVINHYGGGFPETQIRAGSNVTVTKDAFGNWVIASTGGSGSFSVLAATGTVNGTNKSFTFSSAPSVIVVDNGRVMRSTNSDGSTNWTGTTSVTLSVAPNFDIFGY